jgi:hypothetical protein
MLLGNRFLISMYMQQLPPLQINRLLQKRFKYKINSVFYVAFAKGLSMGQVQKLVERVSLKRRLGRCSRERKLVSCKGVCEEKTWCSRDPLPGNN